MIETHATTRRSKCYNNITSPCLTELWNTNCEYFAGQKRDARACCTMGHRCRTTNTYIVSQAYSNRGV